MKCQKKKILIQCKTQGLFFTIQTFQRVSVYILFHFTNQSIRLPYKHRICKPFAENIAAISTSTSFYHHFVLAFLQLYHCNHFMSYLCGQFSPPIFYILYLIEVFLVLCHSKNVTATYSFKHKYETVSCCNIEKFQLKKVLCISL